METHVVISSDIDIAGVPFRLQYQYHKQTKKLIFTWGRGETKSMALAGLSDVFRKTPMNFSVPGQLEDLHLALSSVEAAYDIEKKTFALKLEADRYGSLTVCCDRRDAETVYSFVLEMQSRFLLNSLPVFGSGFTQEDFVQLQEFTVTVDAAGGGQKKLSCQIRLLWKLSGKEIRLQLAENAAVSGQAFGEEGHQQGGQISYVDINKSFGFFELSRVGFAMEGNAVTLYVDAGIRLSVVLLELIGLSLKIPLSLDRKPDFGLRGAAVSLAKPPLSISGGLTLDKTAECTLYSGEIFVQFQGIGVTALCSYGQFSQGGASLFAFFMVSVRLGGPPAFSVTGLAGGFGFQRSIRLPDKVKDVESFPFVAAAMGKGDLKEGMTPAEALAKLNQTVLPAEGQYFFSVGVRFQSFGLLDSLLLCSVEFGERLLLSVLGLSRLSLPVSAQNPLVFLKLALKAVIAPDDGEIRIEGALSDDSYLLDKKCRVNGGFACCIWFGNARHAGDFVITLGGYSSGFHKAAHYPQVDRLGINWKMDDHLTLSAEAYFALTPACAMLGGNLALVYENGRLKAWFKAWAEFFMRWEPFYYDVSVGISVGASYRWDFFPFYTTFRVELGANLELWGPPFGGKVHISWFIISFTISFGKDRPSERNLDWKEFSDTFLESGNQRRERDGGGAPEEQRVITIRPVAGMLKSGEKTGWYLLDADTMELEITSQIASTELVCQETKIASYQGALGIVPMGITKLGSTLTVTFTDAQGEPVSYLLAQPVYRNAPKALWNASKPQQEDTDQLVPQVPFGIRIVSQESSPDGALPEEGSYDMEILCANEKLGPCEFAWETPDEISAKAYPPEAVLRQVEDSIAVTGGTRKHMLEALQNVFGVWTEEELWLDGWEKELERQLGAEPILAVIGASQ